MTNEVKVVGDIALLKVPEGMSRWGIDEEGGKPFTLSFLGNPGEYKCVTLPPGPWQIIGMASEIGEDVASSLVDVAVHMEDYERLVKDGWWNYEGGEVLQTALSSLASLLKAHNLEPNCTVILKRVK